MQCRVLDAVVMITRSRASDERERNRGPWRENLKESVGCLKGAIAASRTHSG